MFVCHTCNKSMSSKQSLQYHAKSRSCVEPDHAYINMCEVALVCDLHGCVNDIKKNTPQFKLQSLLGKSIYDILDDHKEFAMKHIDLLIQRDTLQRIRCIRILDHMFMVLMRIAQNKMYVYCLLQTSPFR